MPGYAHVRFTVGYGDLLIHVMVASVAEWKSNKRGEQRA
jgi:hypothetical protein